MTLEQALIIGISALAGVVGILFSLLMRMYKRQEKTQNDNITKMADASKEFTNALKHQTEVTDKIFNYIYKSVKR